MCPAWTARNHPTRDVMLDISGDSAKASHQALLTVCLLSSFLSLRALHLLLSLVLLAAFNSLASLFRGISLAYR